jgi:hypothetical protein
MGSAVRRRAKHGPEAASKPALKHDVSRSFEGSVADGAVAARIIEDPFSQQIGAALDAPLHQQTSSNLPK